MIYQLFNHVHPYFSVAMLAQRLFQPVHSRNQPDITKDSCQLPQELDFRKPTNRVFIVHLCPNHSGFRGFSRGVHRSMKLGGPWTIPVFLGGSRSLDLQKMPQNILQKGGSIRSEFMIGSKLGTKLYRCLILNISKHRHSQTNIKHRQSHRHSHHRLTFVYIPYISQTTGWWFGT